VRQYALEGEREVACIPVPGRANPTEIKARVYFHIRGRQPNAVTLILRGETLSPLHYTELGWHDHSATIMLADHKLVKDGNTAHSHDLWFDSKGNPLLTAFEWDEDFPDPLRPGKMISAHEHRRFAKTGFIEGSVGGQRGLATTRTDDSGHFIGDEPGDPTFYINGGKHRHQLDSDTSKSGFDAILTHDPKGSKIGSAGQEDKGNTGATPRTGDVLTYFSDLKLSIDGRPVTPAVLDQIHSTLPTADRQAWMSLGNGTSNSPFVLNGTGPIRLDFLPGVQFAEDEHCIEFSVPLGPNNSANGGKVIYNLYIE
jgi:hypothetical protein